MRDKVVYLGATFVCLFFCAWQSAHAESIKSEIHGQVLTGPITEEVVPLPEPVKTSGYDGGFFIQSEDENFRLQWNGNLQFQYTLAAVEDVEDRHGFFLRNSSFGFSGHIGSPKLSWKVGLSFLRPVTFSTGYIQYEFHKAFKLGLGYGALPFGTVANIGLASNSLDNMRFGFGLSAGVWFSGTLGPVDYKVGVFNHGGDTGLAANNNQELAYSGYLKWRMLSKPENGLSWVLSASAGMTHLENSSKLSINTQARVILGNLSTEFKWKRFRLTADVNYRLTDPDQFTRQQNDLGYTVGASFDLVPNHLTFAVRHSGLVDDLTGAGVNLQMTSGRVGLFKEVWSGVDVDGDSDNEFEYSAALIWKIPKANLTTKFQYSYVVDGIPGGDNRSSHFGLGQISLSF